MTHWCRHHREVAFTDAGNVQASACGHIVDYRETCRDAENADCPECREIWTLLLIAKDAPAKVTFPVARPRVDHIHQRADVAEACQICNPRARK